MCMIGFQEGDDVIIEGKNGYIGGIHNHPTKLGLELEFGKNFNLEFDTLFEYNKYFAKTLNGKIHTIGKHNMFIISVEDRKYIFCNDYNEMKKLEKKDKVMK